MKINQVEELVGITKKNIRFYEDQGLLNPERNHENGYREYSLADVETLNKIKLLRKLAFPIDAIRKLQRGEVDFDKCVDEHIIRLNHELHNVELMKQLCMKLSDDVDNLDELKAADYLEEMKRMEAGGAEFMDIRKVDVVRKKAGSAAAAAVVIIILAAMIALIIWAEIEEPIPLPIVFVIEGIFGAMIIGILIALKQRFAELNGGEEDEASKY